MPRPVVAVAVFLFLVLSPAAIAADLKQDLFGPEPASVRIRAATPDGMALGCGTVIEGGRVITAWHVVKDATSVLIVARNGSFRTGAKWTRMGGDVAVIVLDKAFTRIVGVKLYTGKVKDGQAASAYYYWGIEHEHGSVTRMDGRVYPSGRTLPGLKGDLGDGILPVGMPAASSMSGSGLFIGGKLAAVCSAAPSDSFGHGYGYWTRIPR